jgi:hypothetical protein
VQSLSHLLSRARQPCEAAVASHRARRTALIHTRAFVVGACVCAGAGEVTLLSITLRLSAALAQVPSPHCVSPLRLPTVSLPLCLPTVSPHCVSPLCLPTVSPHCVSPLCLPTVSPHCVSPLCLPLCVSPLRLPTVSLPLCLPHCVFLTVSLPLCLPTVSPHCVSPLCLPTVSPHCVSPLCLPTVSPSLCLPLTCWWSRCARWRCCSRPFTPRGCSRAGEILPATGFAYR